jgi:hypothetical protein
MRKNTQAATTAFLRGYSARPARSIWTDGLTLYSYDTAIATLSAGGVILNVNKYSATTTRQQNDARHLFEAAGIPVIEVRPRYGRGVGAFELADLRPKIARAALALEGPHCTR